LLVHLSLSPDLMQMLPLILIFNDVILLMIGDIPIGSDRYVVA